MRAGADNFRCASQTNRSHLLVIAIIMSALRILLVVLSASLCPGDSMSIKDPLSSVNHNSLAICSDCKQLIQLSANLIPSVDSKGRMYETLLALCQHLPDKQALECHSQVKIYLPKILLQPAADGEVDATCAAFGLCAVHIDEEVVALPDQDKEEHVPALTNSNMKEQLNPACTLCVFIIKKLETLLPQNMTEGALMKLMDEVCDLLPKSYKNECDDFVEKYGVQIVEFLLSSAAPHTICTLLHVCLFGDSLASEAPAAPSDCDSCRTLAALSRLGLATNATKPQTSSFLESVCGRHPNAIPKCEEFTRIYGARLQQFWGKEVHQKDICERADLCTAKKSQLLGSNPCTWGPSYWCRDTNTAHKCGNVAFCEKHMWNK
ncbi:surfactant protein Bb isoform X2 [Syngnathoides biaculeatus]|uniref:surfactant protein Bb isoform X2 n=1 Tax=Syngnathoides biaculeatus TaxID=300417 RepID=UPI002ADE3932|nr:surfactant protein Bb isoform X2 [Syngnathoides biaculeatus]